MMIKPMTSSLFSQMASSAFATRELDQKVTDYLNGKKDIMSLSLDVATTRAHFEAGANLIKAAIEIPKTLLNIQV